MLFTSINVVIKFKYCFNVYSEALVSRLENNYMGKTMLLIFYNSLLLRQKTVFLS